MKRRNFIKKTALASSLLYAPNFINAINNIEFKGSFKRLVIVQLSGGNDGLNTVIPFNNDIYYKNRPLIGIHKNKTLKLSDELGLNENLSSLKKLFDKGELSVINNVGYPNPNRSHFRSTDIWHTASNSNEYLTNGWIGRFLDENERKPHTAIQLDSHLSLALKGTKMSGMAVQNANQLFRNTQDPYFKMVLKNYDQQHLNEHNLGYLYKTLITAESSAKYIYQTSKTFNSSVQYPNNPFAKQLKTTAKFINSGLETKVYYTSLSGFDTHNSQKNRQNKLLKTYDSSLGSFIKDLKQNNTFKDTLILTFSEFGRRVKQNAANGTDHGTANNVFIIGENLNKVGIYNELPNLSKLDNNGDLIYSIDFREIYATILKKWLNVNDKRILNNSFKTLNFI